MPGGLLLGLDWRWLGAQLRRRRGHPAPPRVVLLTPERHQAHDVPIYRGVNGADEASDTGEPVEQTDAEAQQAFSTRWEHEYLLELRLAAAALMCWLVWLQVVPLSTLLSAMAWPTYLFVLNWWRFPNKVPPRVPAAAPFFEPTLPRLLSAWRTMMLIVCMLMPLAVTLEAPLFLGGIVGRAVLRNFAPPVFLLAAQLAVDGTLAASPDFWVGHIAVLNPVGFNVLRLVPCWRCASAMWALSSGVVTATNVHERVFVTASALLALSNAVLWTVNLFAYLLPFKLMQLRDTAA